MSILYVEILGSVINIVAEPSPRTTALQVQDRDAAIAQIEKHNKIAEQSRRVVPSKQFSWNFDRLPASAHQLVRTAVENLDLPTLITIHDQYQLSNASYCCMKNGGQAVLGWFKDGIKNGLIQAK